MTYDTVATFCKVSSLIIFPLLFLGVLVYVFLPNMKQKLDKAQHLALDLDDNQDRIGGRQAP